MLAFNIIGDTFDRLWPLKLADRANSIESPAESLDGNSHAQSHQVKKNTFSSIYLAAKRGLPCMGCQPLASWESCHSQLNEWAIIDIELQILSNFRSIKNLNHMINDVRDNSKSSIRSPSWRHLKNSYAQWSCTDAHSTWFNSSCRSYEY